MERIGQEAAREIAARVIGVLFCEYGLQVLSRDKENLAVLGHCEHLFRHHQRARLFGTVGFGEGVVFHIGIRRERIAAVHNAKRSIELLPSGIGLPQTVIIFESFRAKHRGHHLRGLVIAHAEELA